jgi:hypothetical protein
LKREGGCYLENRMLQRRITLMKKSSFILRFQALTAVNVKVVIFWDMTPCSLVDRYRCFRRTCHFHPQGRRAPTLKIELEGASETLVLLYQTRMYSQLSMLMKGKGLINNRKTQIIQV